MEWVSVEPCSSLNISQGDREEMIRYSKHCLSFLLLLLSTLGRCFQCLYLLNTVSSRSDSREQMFRHKTLTDKNSSGLLWRKPRLHVSDPCQDVRLKGRCGRQIIECIIEYIQGYVNIIQLDVGHWPDRYLWNLSLHVNSILNSMLEHSSSTIAIHASNMCWI